MRSSALFIVFLVGAGTIASAQPQREETSGRVSHKEKSEAKEDEPRRPSEWIEIASPTPAKHGTEFVVVGKEAGYFSQLRIEGAKGKTIVRRVKVFFADGSVKSVPMAKTLTSKKFTVIDLGDAKAIDRVVVTTETHTNGQYAIYGAGAAVASR